MAEGLHQHLLGCSPCPWGLCVCGDLEELSQVLAAGCTPVPRSLRVPEPWAAAGHCSLGHCWPGEGQGTGMSLWLLPLLIHVRNAALEPVSLSGQGDQGRAACAAGRDGSGQLDLAAGLDCRVTPAQAANPCPQLGEGSSALCIACSWISWCSTFWSAWCCAWEVRDPPWQNCALCPIPMQGPQGPSLAGWVYPPLWRNVPGVYPSQPFCCWGGYCLMPLPSCLLSLALVITFLLCSSPRG